MLRRLAIAAALSAAACTDSTCDTGVVDVSEVCLPAPAAPGLSLVVDVRESCGRGCSGVPSCTALLRNAQITLTVEQDVCQETLTQECLNRACEQRVIPCQLPSLNEGDYVISAPGSASRVLHVQSGGASTCRLVADGGV
ncbi:MAG TPA: hypothetical protein VFL36_21750 [Myxococcales bacterium]|nr:hypothetical protein [Myxococcales bacterium]